MRSFNFNRMLNAALDLVLGFAIANRVELRALTITGREVSLAPPMLMISQQGTRACKQAPAAWRAWQKAVAHLSSVVASHGPRSAVVRVS